MTRNTRRRKTQHAGKAPGKTARDQTPAEVAELEQAFAASATVTEATLPDAFDALGLPQPLVTAVTRGGVRTPFPIQARAIPDALVGRDVLGRAQTGSGKTLAFGLPLLARLSRLSEGRTRRRPGTPRGLVLVPTRELAEQVTTSLAPLGEAVNVRVRAVYGGAPIRRQIDALARGVDVIVATPGRLLDLIERAECTLSDTEITVIDEADYMADLGFLPDVSRLLDQTPADAQRMLFSATLDQGVSALVRRYLSEPAAHAVTPAAAPVSGMDHRVFTLRPEDKIGITAEITERPGRTLVFVRTKHGADRLAKQLRRTGVEAGAIHGNLTQSARQRALTAFSSGHARVLVATDVAARGIHVDDVDLVIHFDPPADHKDYLHRSGRTARAGNAGVVLSLLLPEQRRQHARLLDNAGVTASRVQVAAAHPAVRDLATSGTPVVPTTPAPSPETRPGNARQGSRRRSGQGSGRGSGQGSGRGSGRGSAQGSGRGSGRGSTEARGTSRPHRGGHPARHARPHAASH